MPSTTSSACCDSFSKYLPKNYFPSLGRKNILFLYGFLLTETRAKRLWSIFYISAILFLALSCNLTFSVFESQFLNSIELLNSC